LACIFGNKNVSSAFSQPVAVSVAAPVSETSSDMNIVKAKATNGTDRKVKEKKKKRSLESAQEERPAAKEEFNEVRRSKKKKRSVTS
jgi:hypothetical protein